MRLSLLGVTFCFLWYGSIILGFYFLYCPVLPLLIFNISWYRKITDWLFLFWESFSTALLEIFCGTRIVIEGDMILPEEQSVLIMNHPTRVDWLFLWCLLQHHSSPFTHRCKYVLKSSVKKIPALGWVMQMTRFIYIKRQLNTDLVLMKRLLSYYRQYCNNIQILIFPEGTNLTPEALLRSREFAQARGLEKFNNVLYPKTTGFAFLIQEMRKNDMLNAIYDITIAYPDNKPETEKHCFQGLFPKRVNFNVHRYDQADIPTNEEGIKEWLHHIWRDKEAMLSKFKELHHFKTSNSSLQPSRIPWHFHLSLFIWLTFMCLSIYITYYYRLAMWWIIFHTLLFLIVSSHSEGIEQIEASLYAAAEGICCH